MPVTGFVYVIESPSDIDLLDGRTEGRALCETLGLSKIPHWYSLATTEKALDEALQTRLGQAWQTFNVPPILHFSCHGNNDGIGLTDGTFVTWSQLRAKLRRLNEALSGGLLLCLSACNGTHACRMAMHTDSERTFWAVVSNSQSPQWSEAAIAYITFYANFFKGIGIDDCVDRMRVASGNGNFMHLLGAQAQQHWVTFMAQQQTKVATSMPQATAPIATLHPAPPIGR